MSFLQFFRILWARRLIILIATIGCFVTAVGVAKILPPRYDAHSRLILDIVKPDPITGEVISSQWARAYVQTQIELIKDYRVAGKVADDAGWASSPELAQQFQNSEASQTMDFRRWLAQKVIDDTQARLIEGSNILEITFSSTNPNTAAQLADLLRDAYVEQNLSFKRETASRNASWFTNQTQKLREELSEAEAKKTAFERKNGIVLNENNVDSDSARLQALAMSAPEGQRVQPGSGIVATAPSASALAQLDASISNAAENLGPNHPQLKQLREQRSALAATVREELSAAQSAASGGKVTGTPVSALYNAQQAKVLRNAGAVGEAKRLAADVAVLRDQFQKAAMRAADLEQESESNETNLTLLGSAIAPQTPEFPKMPLITFGSLILGLVLGVLAALFTELLSRRVRGIEDLNIPDAPLIGSMTPEPKTTSKFNIGGWFSGFRRPSQT